MYGPVLVERQQGARLRRTEGSRSNLRGNGRYAATYICARWEDGCGTRLSPDGRNLLFLEAKLLGGTNADLYLLKLNGDLSPQGNPRQITNEHADQFVRPGLAWTADGRDAI